MTPDETHELLKLVAAATRRTIGEEDVLIWHAALAPLDPARCRAAVLDHIRHQPGVWLEPGHVWAAARTVTDPAVETPPSDPDTGRRMRALLAGMRPAAGGVVARRRVEPAPPWPWTARRLRGPVRGPRPAPNGPPAEPAAEDLARCVRCSWQAWEGHAADCTDRVRVPA